MRSVIDKFTMGKQDAFIIFTRTPDLQANTLKRTGINKVNGTGSGMKSASAKTYATTAEGPLLTVFYVAQTAMINTC